MSNDDVHTNAPLRTPRPRVLLSIPPRELPAFFPADALDALSTFASRLDIVDPADIEDSAAASAAEIAIVAWGFPRLDDRMLRRIPGLRLVINAASSVRSLVSADFWHSGIPLTQAGAAMSPAVAEMSLTLTLSLLRRVHRMDHALRAGESWTVARDIPRGREISGCRIGVIGASRAGREYIRLCIALGADVVVYDPYIPADDPLIGRSRSLDEVLEGVDVLAIHAPATVETEGLVGRRQLAALPDGAVVVNTARASIVDADALFQEVASGRLDAALDVFDDEPLPEHDRWRSLPNALLSGHVSGATRESRLRAGRLVVDELSRFLNGADLRHRVTADALERMG